MQSSYKTSNNKSPLTDYQRARARRIGVWTP
jgi:hypothetical protein